MSAPQALASDRSSGQGGVGSDIRALRKSRAITLTEMAGQIGRSIGWLSQVERGSTEPSIPDLRKIAQLFEVPISFFFRNEEASEAERGTVVRAELRATLGSRHDGLTEELLSPHLSGDFEMIRSRFEPHSKSEVVEARPTQEGGYVVSGVLSLWIGDNEHRLGPGDSFQFQNETYRWENSGDEPAEVIWIISPPVY